MNVIFISQVQQGETIWKLITSCKFLERKKHEVCTTKRQKQLTDIHFWFLNTSNNSSTATLEPYYDVVHWFHVTQSRHRWDCVITRSFKSTEPAARIILWINVHVTAEWLDWLRASVTCFINHRSGYVMGCRIAQYPVRRFFLTI